MSEKRFLYFALGVLSVASVGAVTNQVVPVGREAALMLANDGVIFPDGSFQATAARRDPRRAFYLTDTAYPATGAPTACAAGFHFASLWEIFDMSGLRYATDTEGGGSNVFRRADSGLGPPTETRGWTRTGYDGNTDAGAGRANCNNWQAGGPNSGSTAGLEFVWSELTFTTAIRIQPWRAEVAACGTSRRVWCVEDYPGSAGG